MQATLRDLLRYWGRRSELILRIGGSFVIAIMKILVFAIAGMAISYPVLLLTGDKQLSVAAFDLVLLAFVIWYPSAIFSVVFVSIWRLFRYLRSWAPRYWGRNTPPHDPVEEPRRSTASEEEIEIAENYLDKHTFRGFATFLAMYFSFLYIFFFHTKSFNKTIESLKFEGVTKVLSPFFSPIQGVTYLLRQTNIGQSQLTLLLILVVLPGLVFAPAARNQLYIYENRIQKRFDENGIRGSKDTLVIILTSAFFTALFVMSALQAF